MVKKTTPPTFGRSSNDASKGQDSKSKKAGNSKAPANRDTSAKAVKPAIAEYFAAATEKTVRARAHKELSDAFKAKNSSKKSEPLQEREARAEKFGL